MTASPKFNVDAFVPKLRDYMRVNNPYKCATGCWGAGATGRGGGGSAAPKPRDCMWSVLPLQVRAS